jgi:Spy/CpxP family protein refolding chaperone
MKNTLLTCALLLATAPFALCQGPSADGPGAPPPAPGGQYHAGFDKQGGPDHPMGPDSKMGGGGVGRLLPPGMWWKNPQIVTALALTADQQKRIDDLFLKSRVDLIHAHATLQEDELLLEPILNASTFDQAKAEAQIGKIADTRAALEKTDAHMLLSIRGVLTPDQWTKLQAQRGKHDDHRGPGGPGMKGGYGHHQQPPPPPPPAQPIAPPTNPNELFG